MLEQKFNDEHNADGKFVSQPIAKPNVVRKPTADKAKHPDNI